MNATLSSLEDKSSILYEGRAKKSFFEDIAAMQKEDWRARLSTALEKSDKSKRAVSLAAGLGPGYIHSILSEGKDPTVDNLIAVANALDVSVSYLLYGYDLTPETEKILSLLEKNPEARAGVFRILRSLQDN
ncbi:helix-turn-helix domain-containing protein [Agrobacterium vitis]|nr:helix-turn-helix transcriptional regulator [Agrobacterium vitis]